MGWPTKGSGKSYNSHTGFGHYIGGYSKKVIDTNVMNRLSRICDTAERQNKKARKHECTKNYTGSSKSMEPHVAVQFLLDAPSKKYCIGLITSDDDSTMKAWCTHIDSGNPNQSYQNGSTSLNSWLIQLIVNALLPASSINLQILLLQSLV